MSAGATKTKPEHRRQPVSGVILTPEREAKMSTTVHPPTDTTLDWRDLVDDPMVLDIIRQVARTQRDRMLRDDAESFLTLEAMYVAQAYVGEDRGDDAGDYWYRFLHNGLKLRLRGHHDRVYGCGEAVRVSRATSIESILEWPSQEGRFRPLGQGRRDIDRTEYAITAVGEYPDGIRAAELATELGVNESRARMLLKSGAERGYFVRLRRGLYVSAARAAVSA